ncbi:phenylalanine--tRNA ligase subunit alpha [Stomatohabitans albus]|uniref:phenylalanine--tRNA ligase subunit alpha n=1 Tax=Stomatohabitans albus TaxID=3110766 RepID=UPI00300D9708
MERISIDALRDRVDGALTDIAQAPTLEALAALKASLVGKQGEIIGLRRQLGQFDPEDRKVFGQVLNDHMAAIGQALEARQAFLEIERDNVVLAAERLDLTLPARKPARGSLHPLTETLEQILDVLCGLGYEIVRGVEVESEWFNFDALNAPEDHPSRGLTDTIYVHEFDTAQTREDGTTPMLMRPQTSPMQIRTMLDREPPLAVAIPGRVYRQDTPDATHVPVFHQIEGLTIGTDISMADLFGTLTAFARTQVGDKTRFRFRPHYFPFTEPSVELDAWIEDPSHPDGGKWVEMLGAGMVHPNVLRNGGIDPEQWQGFAFGIGIERTAMVRYGVPDLRLFADNDLRLLHSFA